MIYNFQSYGHPHTPYFADETPLRNTESGKAQMMGTREIEKDGWKRRHRMTLKMGESTRLATLPNTSVFCDEGSV